MMDKFGRKTASYGRALLLFFVIVKKIQSVDCTNGATNPDGNGDNMAIWDNVNLALDSFVREYELRNRVTLTVDRQLKPVDEFEAGARLFYGTYRLEFSFQRGDLSATSSVIVKVPELAGSRYALAEKMLFYDKEKYMFEKVLPSMYQSWSKEKLSPAVYLLTDIGVFFLENLRENGFRTTGARLHDSLEMCIQVVKSLARFHALSTVHLDDDNLRRGLVARTNTTADVQLDRRFVDALMEKYEKYVIPSLQPSATREITYTFETLQSTLLSGYTPSENGFDVILHGDPNRLNVFFPDWRNGAEAMCKFVDFYHSRLGSPVIDLMNYLLTSVQFDVFDAHRDTLFRDYVDEFGRTLPRGREKYDLLHLYHDLRTYKPYFVYKLIFAIPAYWKNTNDGTSPVDNEEDSYGQLLRTERYISFFKNWMEVLRRW